MRVVLFIYLGFATLLGCFQRRLIYGPKRVDSLGIPDGFDEGQVENVSLQTVDGLTLHGWHFKGRSAFRKDPVVAEDDGRLTVLFFSGNAMHRGYRIQEFELLTGMGADVYCFDYRGYAENPGSPSEVALIGDAHAAWKHLTIDQGIPPTRIVLFGESLGGGVATQLAANLCRQGEIPGGLILRSTFSSLVDVAARMFAWLPVRWMLLDRYHSIDVIGDVDCPLLVLHGDLDAIVPYELGQALFVRAKEQSRAGFRKRFVTLTAAGHNDYLDRSMQLFRTSVSEFLKECEKVSAD